jgi:hypothetical protein
LSSSTRKFSRVPGRCPVNTFEAIAIRLRSTATTALNQKPAVIGASLSG